jgi:glycosyl-4,4'-diaponeurosporenoate acyltransferase
LHPGAPLFRLRPWEDEGRVYDRLFAVRRWKGLLPDGGAAWKQKGYQKKKLTDLSQENLERFIVESARAELTHMLAILPFWVFGFFAPPNVVWIMLAYALAVNLPCMIAQRYNRPRVRALLKRLYPNSPLV